MQERQTLHCLHAREFTHKSRSAHFGIHIQHFDFAFEFSILHWLRLSAAFSGRDPRFKAEGRKRKEFRCCWVDLVSSGLPLFTHIHPFLGVRLTLNPNSTAGGWRHKLLVTPGQPCAGWGTTHTCPPKQNRRHPSLQSAQGQRPSPKSCALSSDSCKHTCTARISL